VVRRDPDVSRAVLDHLQDGMQHTDHGVEGFVLGLVETLATVELAEQLVGAVDDVENVT
jgi:hypothetical protein